jgi:hypothetical protein
MTHHMRPLLIAALCAANFALPALAQEEDAPPPVRTGIRWIDWAAEQVNFTLREAEPAPEPAPEVTPAEAPEAAPEEKMPVLSPTHSIETMEMLRLQQEVRLLRELIEEGVVGRVAALEAEVHELKSSMKGQRGAGPIIPQPDGSPPSRLPMPDASAASRVVEKVLPEAPAAPETKAADFAFTVVDEWGRSPEAVAELGGTASTLIGVSGLVPAGSSRADVVALAQELRTKYKDYDNIVIEVFDSEASARTFADAQTVDAESRVLSISKAKADGRDLMIYFGGELPEALTP